MVEEAPTLRWGVEKRMEFIEACLFWLGLVNRTHLSRRFGISVPQASADLARYRELAPGNMAYDPSRKTHVATPAFAPAFGAPAVDGTLEELAASAAGRDGAADSPWLDGVDASMVRPRARRDVRVDALRQVLAAVRRERAVEIAYQSFSRPRPSQRWIEPHALAHDGERWHVRAFCAERGDFRDFVLSRIFSVGGSRPAAAPRAADLEWIRQIPLRLAPNPALDEGVRRGLEVDYGMRGGSFVMKVRACFVFYVERRLGLEVAPGAGDPERLQLVLVNRDEVTRRRARAREDTRKALLARG